MGVPNRLYMSATAEAQKCMQQLTIYAIKSKYIHHLSCALGKSRPNDTIAGDSRKRSAAFSSSTNRKNCLDVWMSPFEGPQIIKTALYATITIDIDLGVGIFIAELWLRKFSPEIANCQTTYKQVTLISYPAKPISYTHS